MALEGENSLELSCYLKWIHWNSGKIPIIMQSRNGPCPLIATLNVLLLREKVRLPSMLEQITTDQLLTYLGECIMDILPPPTTTSTTTDKSGQQQEEPTTQQAIAQIQEQLQSLQIHSPVSQEGAVMNMEQHIHDAMEILPKLKTGLDVNMRFTSITDFEYTPECIIFDLLRIPLYHGWIIDPTLTELYSAIGSQSYNQLMDSLVANKNSQREDLESTLTNMVMIESFLEQTASQLTHYGLEELHNKIKDNELGILFRNNHFLTLFKRDGSLYTLVTDHGYLTEDTVVWEILDSVEGAGRFFDSNFQASQVSSNARALEQKLIEAKKQVMDDLMMALSLEEEERAAAGQSALIEGPRRQQDPSTIDDDMKLAKKLQAEWDSQYSQSLWPATTEQPANSSTRDDQHNPSSTKASKYWPSVFGPMQKEKSAGQVANELDQELLSPANDHFDTNKPLSESSSQVVVVSASPQALNQVSEQAASLAQLQSADSLTWSSAITNINTSTATTTTLSTSVLPREELINTTTAVRPTPTSGSLGGTNNESKNLKDSNCTVS